MPFDWFTARKVVLPTICAHGATRWPGANYDLLVCRLRILNYTHQGLNGYRRVKKYLKTRFITTLEAHDSDSRPLTTYSIRGASDTPAVTPVDAIIATKQFTKQN